MSTFIFGICLKNAGVIRKPFYRYLGNGVDVFKMLAGQPPEGQILKPIVDETALIDYPMLSEIRLGDIGEMKP